MSTTLERSTIHTAPAAGILLVALLATWFAYSPGITGALYFDDHTSLGGLENIHDKQSAMRFILSGRAGPLGRPLALASFVPEASAWPDEPAVFLRTNILIHLLNGALVAWLLYLLGTARRQSRKQASLIAAGSAAIWMLMPILASSSFLIVQRMTTLSAAFVLAGTIAYFYARRSIESRPLLALCGMTIALVLGAILAVFSKENGALLPLLILAMEATLLSRPTKIPASLWRTWFGAVLVAPTVILLAYLATRLPYPEGVVQTRDFNGLERLLTQAHVLWKYLYLAFIPNLAGLGPFHDDQAIQRTLLHLPTLLAVSGWAITISVAILMRRRAPLFSFAVAWYLLGHSLESTTMSLELYFEHRNYLPLIGPIYALVASIAHAEIQWRRLSIIAVCAYSIVLGGVLYSVASLWGTPPIAAEMWYIYKPDSIRAAERIAQQMELQGDPRTALKIFREVRERRPDAHHLDLQILLFSCVIEPNVDQSEAARLLERQLRVTRFSHGVKPLLERIYGLVRLERCKGMDMNDVYRLGQSVLDNVKFSPAATRQAIHAIQAQVAMDLGEQALALEHVDHALSVEPDPETLKFVVNMLNSAKMHDVAERILRDAPGRAPSHPLRARAWSEEVTRLQRLQASLDE